MRGMVAKSEARMPKSERNPKSEIGTTLSLSSGTSNTLANGRGKESLFRISGFGLLSEFGSRFSDLVAPHFTQNAEQNSVTHPWRFRDVPVNLTDRLPHL